MKKSEIIFESVSSSNPKYRVFVPITHPLHVRYLMTIASAIAKHKGGEVLIGHVMELSETQPDLSAKRYIERFKKLLDEAVEYGKELGVESNTLMKIHKEAKKGILEILEEKVCNIMVLGWREDIAPTEKCFGSTMNKLLMESKCDVIVIKIGEPVAMRKILVPISQGPNSSLALEIASLIAKPYNGSVTACIVLHPNSTPEKKLWYDNFISEKIDTVEKEAGLKIEKKIIESKSETKAILKESEKYDGILFGATMRGAFKSLFFKTIPEILSEKTNKTLIVAKKNLPS